MIVNTTASKHRLNILHVLNTLLKLVGERGKYFRNEFKVESTFLVFMPPSFTMTRTFSCCFMVGEFNRIDFEFTYSELNKLLIDFYLPTIVQKP